MVERAEDKDRYDRHKLCLNAHETDLTHSMGSVL